MGAIDKFLTNLNLGGGDSADDYYDDYDEDTVEQPRKFAKNNRDSDENKAVRFSKAVAIGGKKKAVPASYEIHLCKPSNMDEARDITDALLQNMAVLLNLTRLNSEMGQRVLDFAMGTTYALSGTIKEITDNIYVIVPYGVDINGALDSEEDAE